MESGITSQEGDRERCGAFYAVGTGFSSCVKLLHIFLDCLLKLRRASQPAAIHRASPCGVLASTGAGVLSVAAHGSQCVFYFRSH
jgi:hypothetical protein